MEYFSSTGQLVALGLVDSSIGAVSKRLVVVDMKASIAKEPTSANLSSLVPSKGLGTRLEFERTLFLVWSPPGPLCGRGSSICALMICMHVHLLAYS